MKRIISILLILFVCATEAGAQDVYLGIRGGLGGGTIATRPFNEKKGSFGAPEFGISILYKGKGKYVDGLEADISYASSEFSWLAKVKSDSSYTRRINSVEIPIMWHARFDMAKERFSVFINLGPYISYDLSSTESWQGNNIKGSRWEERSQDYEYDKLRDNRLGYGIIGGGGISYLIAGRILIAVEARYKFGLSDIYRNPNEISKVQLLPITSQPISLLGRLSI
ncbi:MAG: outer membrane beta-barrel protein [Rikenellaceae bacterium]